MSLHVKIPSVVYLGTAKPSGGGGGGTSDYSQLTNKPQINGIILTGNKTSADLGIKTYSAFPSDFVTSGTFEQLVESITSSSSAIAGNAFLGGIAGSCTPWGSGNAECKVEYMVDGIAVLTVNSADVAPHSWFYNTASGDLTWRYNVLQVSSMPEASSNSENIIVQYVGTTSADYTNGYFYKCTQVEGSYTWVRLDVQPTTTIINNTSTTTTNEALSANMGKELQDQVNNLKNIGKFLSIWDCTTGLPTTDPTVSPYAYHTGDYYRVGAVASGGGTNYKPNGSQYISGQASTTVETETVEVGAVYYYDGSIWRMQAAGGGGTVQDVQVNGTTVVASGTGIANIPVANGSTLGVIKSVKIDNSSSIIDANGDVNIPVSSGSASGVMTSAQYTKLNGIETGADVTDATNVNAAGAVMYTAQSKTDNQKAQARANIGAAAIITVEIDLD